MPLDSFSGDAGGDQCGLQIDGASPTLTLQVADVPAFNGSEQGLHSSRQVFVTEHSENCGASPPGEAVGEEPCKHLAAAGL